MVARSSSFFDSQQFLNYSTNFPLVMEFLLLVPILSEINPIHALTIDLLKIHFNILQSLNRYSKWSPSLVPNFAGSNPTEAVGFFRAKKSSARLPSEGKLSRLSHVVDLRHVKDPWMLRGRRAFWGKIHRPFLAHVVTPLAARISRRRLVVKVGTFENKKAHKHLHLWPLGPHRRRLAVRAGTSKVSTISRYGWSTFGALATEAQ